MSLSKHTGRVAAASALAGVAIPYVHAAGNNTIQVALIGCGGRGTGAAANAMSVKNGPVKLVAMADVFPDRLNGSYDASEARQCGDKVDVPPERKFIGFDAYQNAMDCLKPGDIAIFTTPLAFRWVHFTYAIEKGLHVFMEKPLTADGPTSRRMLKLARRGRGQEPQGGRGLDVPSQPGPAGTGPAHPGRRNRRHHSAARLPHARAGGSAFSHQMARQQPANCCGRSSGSTVSSGPAAAVSATSTSTSSIISAG